MAPVRYLDIVLLVLAAPFVILMGGPVLGYAVGAGVWIVQRIAEAWLDAAVTGRTPRRAVGLKFGSMVGRTWLVAIAILAVGLAAEREDGFTAAVVCLAAYTVHLATALILRPLERNTRHVMTTRRSASPSSWAALPRSCSCSRSSSSAGRALDNEEFAPQNEFKLDTWIELGPVRHQQGGPLPVHRRPS